MLLRPRPGGSQRESSTEDDEDWDRGSVGSAFEDGSIDDWAIVGNTQRCVVATNQL